MLIILINFYQQIKPGPRNIQLSSYLGPQLFHVVPVSSNLSGIPNGPTFQTGCKHHTTNQWIINTSSIFEKLTKRTCTCVSGTKYLVRGFDRVPPSCMQCDLYRASCHRICINCSLYARNQFTCASLGPICLSPVAHESC